jgi:hypothetical protein
MNARRNYCKRIGLSQGEGAFAAARFAPRTINYEGAWKKIKSRDTGRPGMRLFRLFRRQLNGAGKAFSAARLFLERNQSHCVLLSFLPGRRSLMATST